MVLFKLNSDLGFAVLLSSPLVVVSLRKFLWILLDDIMVNILLNSHMLAVL